MREIRLSGLEGGGTVNRFSLYLPKACLRRVDRGKPGPYIANAKGGVGPY